MFDKIEPHEYIPTPRMIKARSGNFHKQKDKYFTILWKFDEKMRKKDMKISRKKLEEHKNDEKSVK